MTKNNYNRVAIELLSEARREFARSSLQTFAELWGPLQRTQATRYTGTCIPIGFMVAYFILILRIVKRFMGILPVFGVLAPLRSVFLPSPAFSWV